MKEVIPAGIGTDTINIRQEQGRIKKIKAGFVELIIAKNCLLIKRGLVEVPGVGEDREVYDIDFGAIVEVAACAPVVCG